MAEGLDVFKARISATDDTSAVLSIIKEHAKALGLELKKVGSAQGHLEHPSVWAHMREHTAEAGKSFGELGEHVGGVTEKLGELVPALSALGAVGSLAALVENTEHMSEAYAEMAHSAESLGISTQQLSDWNIVAKLTDTNAESMGKSMARLNRTLADTTHGKNKDAAALFKQLHLDPRSFKDSAAALPALANAFAHTTNATMRARMAQVLFGRAGTDMIPLLRRGADGIRELQAEAAKLGPNFTEIGPGLEAYNESMKKMGVATDAFRYVIAGELAPILSPIVDDITDWTVANRQWIATGIKDEVKELSGWVHSVNWDEIGSEVGGWAHSAKEFVEAIGGAKTVVEVLVAAMAIKGTVFLFKETAQAGLLVFQLGAQIVQLAAVAFGWGRVAVAAEAAAAAEKTAAAAAPGGGGNALGPGLGAGRLAVKGLAMAGLVAGTVMDAQNGVQVTQQDVKNNPSLGQGMTPAQIAALPKNRGLGAWFQQETGLDPNKSMFDGPSPAERLGNSISSGWHSLWGGGVAAAPGQGGITPPPGMGGAQSGGRVEGHVAITVDLNGAPPGTSASAKASGAAGAPKVNVTPNTAFHDD